VCEMLQVLEAYPLKALGFSLQRFGAFDDGGHAVRPYRDRNTYLGDPRIRRESDCTPFVDAPCRVDQRHAFSRIVRHPRRHLGVARQPMRSPRRRITRSSTPRENAVSVTYTINDDFGAKVIAGDTGLLLERRNGPTSPPKPGTANLFRLVQGKANAICTGQATL